MPYLNVCGEDIYYGIYGSGEALLLLHGNGEDSTYFHGQINEFRKYYKVIAIDSRGHGKSGGGYEKMKLSDMAGDVFAVMDKLGIQKAHILGFSDGGNIALYMALADIERIGSLILNGANLHPAGLKLWVRVTDLLTYALLCIKSIISKSAQKKRNITALMINSPDIKPDKLRNINVPTLVIAGEKDMIKQSHTQLIADSIPGAKLVIIKNADHFAAREKPCEFNSAVLEFLSGL